MMVLKGEIFGLCSRPSTRSMFKNVLKQSIAYNFPPKNDTSKRGSNSCLPWIVPVTSGGWKIQRLH
ncbi:hypothetical protein C2845_PM10G02670 [Panicum miliaceum]|uniref:Uncharacterized protein n=1 Tax=Panicum miliaceum TaxID=4540 RepID=A0A3L6PGL3_PANMI|nr:hypothetical protein C2845_PM10G02670 [Panicum miliaceum]